MNIEDEKYWGLLGRYLSNELSLEETNELLSWIEQDPSRVELLQELQASWDQAIHYKNRESEYFNVDLAWQKVSAKIENHQTKRTIHYGTWLKVAAILLVLLNISWFTFKYIDNRKQITVTNPDAQVKRVEIPDGSTVWLSRGSQFVYQKGIADLNERELLLKGEAFFEVAPNKHQPFTVMASNTKTRVLGTSFNINSHKGAVVVSVLTGKVSFQSVAKDKEEIILLPHEVGSYNNKDGMLKSKSANNNFLFWRDRQLSFNNERVEDVLTSLENNYQVQFEVQNKSLLNRRITTSFKEVSFDEVKQVLEVLLNCQIEKSASRNHYVVK